MGETYHGACSRVFTCFHARKNQCLTWNARYNSIAANNRYCVKMDILEFWVSTRNGQRLWEKKIRLDYNERSLIWLVVPVLCLHQTNVMHRQANCNELDNDTKRKIKTPNNCLLTAENLYFSGWKTSLRIYVQYKTIMFSLCDRYDSGINQKDIIILTVKKAMANFEV